MVACYLLCYFSFRVVRANSFSTQSRGKKFALRVSLIVIPFCFFLSVRAPRFEMCSKSGIVPASTICHVSQNCEFEQKIEFSVIADLETNARIHLVRDWQTVMYHIYLMRAK